MYRAFEIECQKCKHKFMWIEGSDIRTSYICYRRRGVDEELISTYCPKCNTEIVIIKEDSKGISVQDKLIEIADVIRGV